jgi:hypothetical protein
MSWIAVMIAFWTPRPMSVPRQEQREMPWSSAQGACESGQAVAMG